MDAAEFSRLRALTGRSQKDLAGMLGVSRKAVESYEQGWRQVPPVTERMLYYIAFKLRISRLEDQPPCWKARNCPEATKSDCPAWKSRDGHFCWFITGRLCAAARHSAEPDRYCFGCPVFTDELEAVSVTGD
ncbi:MAG: helix-turn-helix domain-containing protein [Rectinemataceae bacterium]